MMISILCTDLDDNSEGPSAKKSKKDKKKSDNGDAAPVPAVAAVKREDSAGPPSNNGDLGKGASTPGRDIGHDIGHDAVSTLERNR